MPQPSASPRQIFDPIARSYELWAQALGLFQYRRWRRTLVSKAAGGGKVLDVCTGTAGVALELAHRNNARVAGIDLSREMLLAGQRAVDQRGLVKQIALAQGRAEALPFPDDAFDTVVFTFLLRYVKDPQSTIAELVRVLKPGGRLASLEFSVPGNRLIRWLWLLYTRAVMPLASLPLSRGWRRVASFLGPSISGFYRRHGLNDVADMWRDAGVTDVDLQRLSLGGAIVMWGTKES